MDRWCRIRLKESIVAILQVKGKSSDLQLDDKPAVLLIVGVNGGGKTTTIGKLAHKLGNEGAKAGLSHSCHAICAPATTAQAQALYRPTWIKRRRAELWQQQQLHEQDADALLCMQALA